MGQASKAIPLIALGVGAVWIGTRGSGRLLSAGRALAGGASPAAPVASSGGQVIAGGTQGGYPAGYNPANDPAMHAGGGGQGPARLTFLNRYRAQKARRDGSGLGPDANSFSPLANGPATASSGPNSFNPGFRASAFMAGTWSQPGAAVYQHPAAFTGHPMISSEGN